MYSRLLIDLDQVEHFLKEVLEYDYENELPDIAYDICQREQGLLHVNVRENTLDSVRFRHRDYKDDMRRKRLRTEIIEELYVASRLQNDEEICLGKGGSKPIVDIVSQGQAYIVIGLPASGKSSICNQISDQFGAMVIDSDYAKRKLPEYSKFEYGATLVHAESSQIIWGSKSDPNCLYSKALQDKHNIVIPTVGQKIRELLMLSDQLRRAKYKVHLILVSLLRKEATIRAIKRFNDTSRYVPLGLIFDGFGNDPILNYYMIKARFSTSFDSYGAITTNVPLGHDYMCIDLQGDNTPCNRYAMSDALF